jgi:hypothetical protein
MKIRTILSAGLLVSFFLPWINILRSFISFGGHQLPKAIGTMVEMLGSRSPIPEPVSYLFYGLYLIPLCCVINIIKDLGISQIKRYFLNEFVIGFVFSAIILVIMIVSDKETKEFGLSIGYYLTALLSLIGLFVEIK